MVCLCVYGVPFGPAPAWLFRYGVRLVIAEGFRYGKRPNGMAVGFSLLPMWLVMAREGTQAKRNPGLARARELRESVVFENSWLFRGCFCARKTKLMLIFALIAVNFRFFLCAFKN